MENEMLCRRDNTPMVEGFALNNQMAWEKSERWGSVGYRIAPAILVKVKKCPKCGRSITI